MPTFQRLHLAGCAAIVAYALAYAGVDYVKLPRVYYFPLERELHLAARVKGVPMGYVGLWLYAALAALVVGGGLWLALRWRKTPVSPSALGLATAWAATATLLGLGYYTWMNWP